MPLKPKETPIFPRAFKSHFQNVLGIILNIKDRIKDTHGETHDSGLEEISKTALSTNEKTAKTALKHLRSLHHVPEILFVDIFRKSQLDSVKKECINHIGTAHISLLIDIACTHESSLAFTAINRINGLPALPDAVFIHIAIHSRHSIIRRMAIQRINHIPALEKMITQEGRNHDKPTAVSQLKKLGASVQIFLDIVHSNTISLAVKKAAIQQFPPDSIPELLSIADRYPHLKTTVEKHILSFGIPSSVLNNILSTHGQAATYTS